MGRLPALLAALAPWPAPATAQEAPFALARPEAAPSDAGGVLVIDLERVLAESALGRTLLGELEAETQALEAENREIEARLRAEERALTERRPEMEPEAFRAEAEAFDERVQRIRATQDAKGREVLSRREAIRGRVLEDAVPVLAGVLQERGAVAILDRRSVFLSADRADVTSEVIRGIDAAQARRAEGADAGSPEASPPPGVGTEPTATAPGAAVPDPELRDPSPGPEAPADPG